MDVHKRAIERLRHAVYKVHMLMVVQLIQQLKCSNPAHTSMLTARYIYECMIFAPWAIPIPIDHCVCE